MRLHAVIILALLAAAPAGAQTTRDNPHGKLRMSCAVCHVTSGWTVSKRPEGFDHAQTGYALAGRHADVSCRACHRDLTFAHVGSSCVDCHTDIHRGQLGPQCDRCHSPSGWEDRRELFSQHAERGFPLLGMHAAVDCDACHRGRQRQEFAGTPQDCYACHAADYNRTTDPPHAARGISTACEQCHQPIAGWGSGSFDHTALAGFALTGAHAAANCASCHTGGRWAGLPADCYGCHTTSYSGTTNPPHASSGIPTSCEQCHDTNSWGTGTFNHAQTPFALTGAHTTTACTACHTNGQWAGLPSDCYSCHTASFAATTNPGHAAAQFPTTCETCHSTTAWQPSTWNHAQSGFALTGSHTTTACSACHTGGRWTGLPTDCYGCHTANYSGTTNPPHASSGLPTTCEQCHDTNSWGTGTFNHAQTAFALSGAHTTTACNTCHTNGRWTGLPTDCNSCHAANYASATNPGHAAAQFPTTCETCHSTTAWQPSTWNHNQTGFTLTGSHTTTACASCHRSGQWIGLPTDCYGCHATNYTGTSNPGHAAAQFPTTCETCHSTTAWQPSTWNHDPYFPIYSGRHAGAWTSCADCHVNRADYSTFECIECHTHSQSSTDSAHGGVSGYQYLSSACFRCHPTGRAG